MCRVELCIIMWLTKKWLSENCNKLHSFFSMLVCSWTIKGYSSYIFVSWNKLYKKNKCSNWVANLEQIRCTIPIESCAINFEVSYSFFCAYYRIQHKTTKSGILICTHSCSMGEGIFTKQPFKLSFFLISLSQYVLSKYFCYLPDFLSS
jgi:hypothetical protein